MKIKVFHTSRRTIGGRSVLLEIQRSCEVDVDVGFDYKSAARELGI